MSRRRRWDNLEPQFTYPKLVVWPGRPCDQTISQLVIEKYYQAILYIIYIYMCVCVLIYNVKTLN